MTEREWREREELVTTTDIMEEILQIDGLFDEMSSSIADKELSKTVQMLVRILRKKELYKTKISKKHTRKQSLISQWRDRRQEKQENKIQLLKQQYEDLKVPQNSKDDLLSIGLENKPRKLISALKQQIKAYKKTKLLEQPSNVENNLPSPANPPKVEEQQSIEGEIVQEEAVEGYVVVDNLEEDTSEGTEDVLNF